MKRNNQLSRVIHKLFQNNRFVAIFSLAVAVTIWLVISISENPQRTITVTNVPLTIDTQGTLVEEIGIEVVSKDLPETVSVVVSGPSYIVSSLKGSDLSVSASLAPVTKAGTYTLELNASRVSSKTGYEILSVTPSTVSAIFDFVDTKTFEIKPSAIGVSASAGLILEKPTFTDASKSTVTISGSREVMSKIASVEAVANAEKVLSNTTVFDAELKFYDDNGKPVDVSILNIPFNSVEITVPIYKEKTVPVIYSANSSQALKSIPYTFSSKTVVVRGEPQVIDTMTNIELADINLSDIPKDQIGKYSYVFTPSFKLPSSVKVVDGEDFTVKFNLSQYKIKTIEKAVESKNLSTGFSAKFDKSKYTVTVCGPKTVINNMNAENITLWVDCASKGVGVYTEYLKTDFSKYPTVWALGKIEATLTIQ